MKTAKISELKNNLSRFLAYVRRGGTVRVFDRDVPVADLTPCGAMDAGDSSDTSAALLAALERDGVIVRGTATLPQGFLTRRLPKAKAGVLQALLDERRETR